MSLWIIVLLFCTGADSSSCKMIIGTETFEHRADCMDTLTDAMNAAQSLKDDDGYVAGSCAEVKSSGGAA